MMHNQRKIFLKRKKGVGKKSYRREKNREKLLPPASLKTQRTQRNDGTGKRLNAEKKYYLSLRDGSGYRKTECFLNAVRREFFSLFSLR
jgi:hypothetical protein